MQEQLEFDFSAIEKEIKKKVKNKKKPKSSTLTDEDFALLEFKRVLNQEPPSKLLKKNKQYGNKYIPLQVVEQMLSAIFTAHSIIIPFAPQLMEGQILTVVHLKLLHPVLKEWITYSGMSSVPLIAAEQETMKWNHRNIPASKGWAILNAAKDIGQIFRAEKDDFTDVMRPYFEEKIESSALSKEDEAKTELKGRLFKMIEASKTIKSLSLKLSKVAEMDDKELTEAYKKKQVELKNKK